MRVLIACEESQEVCKAFRSLGHEAYSCDLVECTGGHPEWHIIGDVQVALRRNWDLIVAHPPCTYLAISGNRWFKDNPTRYKRRLDGIRFFFQFVFHDCPKIAIEQPKGIMSSVYRKPDQIIQPWQFGHGEIKATHLWLKGLPPWFRPTLYLVVRRKYGRCGQGLIDRNYVRRRIPALQKQWPNNGDSF